MLGRLNNDAPRVENASPTDRLLMRAAVYLILEPIASSVALGFVVGGVGGNVASFGFGLIVGLIASSILRDKYVNGRLDPLTCGIQNRTDLGVFLLLGGLAGIAEAVFHFGASNPMTIGAMFGAAAVGAKKLLLDSDHPRTTGRTTRDASRDPGET